MIYWQWMSVLGVTIFPFAALALTLDCTAHIIDDRDGMSLSLPLKRADFDRHYLRTQWREFSFGVDQFKLPQRTLGLVILDEKQNQASTSYTGLRQIEGSSAWTTSISQIQNRKDGSRLNLEIACFSQ